MRRPSVGLPGERELAAHRVGPGLVGHDRRLPVERPGRGERRCRRHRRPRSTARGCCGCRPVDPRRPACGRGARGERRRRVARHLELGIVGGGALRLLDAAVERERERRCRRRRPGARAPVRGGTRCDDIDAPSLDPLAQASHDDRDAGANVVWRSRSIVRMDVRRDRGPGGVRRAGDAVPAARRGAAQPAAGDPRHAARSPGRVPRVSPVVVAERRRRRRRRRAADAAAQPGRGGTRRGGAVERARRRRSATPAFARPASSAGVPRSSASAAAWVRATADRSPDDAAGRLRAADGARDAGRAEARPAARDRGGPRPARLAWHEAFLSEAVPGARRTTDDAIRRRLEQACSATAASGCGRTPASPSR